MDKSEIDKLKEFEEKIKERKIYFRKAYLEEKKGNTNSPGMIYAAAYCDSCNYCLEELQTRFKEELS